MENKPVVTCSMTPTQAIEVLRTRADYIERHFPAHEACVYGAQSQIDAMRMGAEAIESSSKAKVSRIGRSDTDFYVGVMSAVLSGSRSGDPARVFDEMVSIRDDRNYTGTLRWRCSVWLYEQLNGLKRGEQK